MQLADSGLLLSDVVTREALENAIRVLHAISGSTNAIIHLIAYAGRLGIELPLQLFDEPWILTKGGPVNATLTMVIYLYQHSFQYGELGFGASIAYVLTMVIAILSFLQLKLFGAESDR